MRLRQMLLLAGTTGSLWLAGCAALAPAGDLAMATTVRLRGSVMGGHQPVAFSALHLYAVGATGTASAADDRLAAGTTSDAQGGFNLSASFTCPTATAPMYLVARGGNPGNGTNAALTLMAALGPCSSLAGSHITVDEVTTVAAVWALAPFMSGFDHVGARATNAVGLANAFSVAANLASTDRGQAPGDVVAGTVVPSAEINTLANALASCVNSNGATTTGTPCGVLFAAATPSGGVAPTETVGAALNIAQNPATNVAAVYNTVLATGPFQPTLASAPNDWTVAMSYPFTGTLAFDVNGNAWVQTGSAAQQVSPRGVVLNAFTSMAGSGMTLDPSGNIWTASSFATLRELPANFGTPISYAVAGTSSLAPAAFPASDGSGNIYYDCGTCGVLGKLTNAGVSTTYPLSISRTRGLAIDQSGNTWVGNITINSIDVRTSAGGTYLSSPFSTGSSHAYAPAIDSAGNAWVVGGTAARLTSSGTATSFASQFAGLNSAQGVAVDGAGTAWIINNFNVSNAYNGELSAITSGGTAVTPILGYVSNTFSMPYTVAIDRSGNVWTGNTGASTTTVFVGLARPVVTPFALGLANGTLATEP